MPQGVADFPLRSLKLRGGEDSSTAALNTILLASVNVQK